MKTVKVKSLGNCPYLVSLEQDDVVGEGSYGKVVKAYNQNNPSERLVAKIFNIGDLRKESSALQELLIVNKLPKHQNLVEYKKVKISSQNYIYIIMEHCEKGSLKEKIIQKEGYFDEKQIWWMIESIVEGYKVLYDNQIVHRDIKPENILIDEQERLKICDFGLAELISSVDRTTQVKGSLFYMAPELLQNKSSKITSQNDVYSLGVLIYYLCFKKYPYFGTKQPKSLKQFKDTLANSELSLNHSIYSYKLRDLLSSMLEKDQKKRCKWTNIFPQILSQSIPHLLNKIPIKQGVKLQFRIIEISDTFLKNLSLMDIDLQRELKRQSVVIVDSIEIDILTKRDFVYYCDRLYTRLSKINDKIGSIKIKLMIDFLTVSNFLHAAKLFQQFNKSYYKIEKSDLLKIVGSHKYLCLKTVIKQDYQALKKLVQENKVQKLQQKFTVMNINGQIYEQCPIVIQQLAKYNQLGACCEIDQLQQYYQMKSTSILYKIRKNENALSEFQNKLMRSSRQQIIKLLSNRYHRFFDKLA